jgi:hypothetical protein
LYIVGLRARDAMSHALEHGELREIEKPVPGCIITWGFKRNGHDFICHMGVVTSTDPILVTHRDGALGPLVENEPLELVPLRFGQKCYDIPENIAPFDLEKRFSVPTRTRFLPADNR